MDELYRGLRDAAREALGFEKPRKGKLGYIIDGIMQVQCSDDPSRAYVRFPDNSYARFLHKGKVKLTPVADVEGTAVDTGKDERGFPSILGIASDEAPGIVTNRGLRSQIGTHDHTIEDITEIGDGTPTANRVLFANGTQWDGVLLETALDTVLTGDATGFVRRVSAGVYVRESIVTGGADLIDAILTSGGEVLVSGGFVLTSGG